MKTEIKEALLNRLQHRLHFDLDCDAIQLISDVTKLENSIKDEENFSFRAGYAFEKKTIILYDVCCDYSLDADVSDKSRVLAETKAYSWHEGFIDGSAALFGYEKSTGELHYAKSPRADLQGMVVDF